MAWVTNDGEYNGSSAVLVFDYSQLTPQQWENLENMSDSLRFEYVDAIIGGRTAEAEEIELEGLG